MSLQMSITCTTGQVCPSGYVCPQPNPVEAQECLKCTTDSCSECSPATLGTCIACNNTFVLKDGNCIAKADIVHICDKMNVCDDGKYCDVKESGNTCEACNNKCQTCSSKTKCTSCSNGNEMNTDQTCTTVCNDLSYHQMCKDGGNVFLCGSEGQQTACVCGGELVNCKLCTPTKFPPKGDCTALACTCDVSKPNLCTGCVDNENFTFSDQKCSANAPTSCIACLIGYILEDGNCKKCDSGYAKLGDYCFQSDAQKEEEIPNKLSGGAIAGIVVGVALIVLAVGGGLAYYFINKQKK
ncbi:Cysteine-rich membrane protein 2 [Spironucleus salmonicida]|uniref:Cysteine-rich membrane protein 2 n=1 Tax=Spironucleus salmonicida TaxID=348837 RepID=V6LKA9_9EUKA|nr:Cysteine-rich membrane protein 2 [Spironucleus salmonicida]|eukprot:EST44773.1 Cysteine-rich membrane protein 2 [Spironucleus salmonicida]